MYIFLDRIHQTLCRGTSLSAQSPPSGYLGLSYSSTSRASPGVITVTHSEVFEDPILYHGRRREHRPGPGPDPTGGGGESASNDGCGRPRQGGGSVSGVHLQVPSKGKRLTRRGTRGGVVLIKAMSWTNMGEVRRRDLSRHNKSGEQL